MCVNLISSPGSGKTLLLEKTLDRMDKSARVAVLTGDLQTENDAKRLAKFGFPVKQIVTGGTCHLDARMMEKHLADWKLEDLDLLIVENVGNLVCPSSYDLGEDAKIVLLSTTEGEDKPLKYPSIFFKSELMVLTKIDLLPYVPFSAELAKENARRVHPQMEILELSSTTGEGLDRWMEWLQARQQKAKSKADPLARKSSAFAARGDSKLVPFAAPARNSILVKRARMSYHEPRAFPTHDSVTRRRETTRETRSTHFARSAILCCCHLCPHDDPDGGPRIGVAERPGGSHRAGKAGISR